MENLLKKLNRLPALITLLVIMEGAVLLIFSTHYLDEVYGLLKASSAHFTFFMAVYSLLVGIAIIYAILYKSNRQAKRNKEELAGLIATIDPTARLVVDSKNKIIQCNGSVERLLGYDPEEVLGHSISIIIPEPLEKIVFEFADHNRNIWGKYSLGIVVDGTKKNGNIIPLEINIGKTKNTNNKVLFLRDMSKRKIAEIEIKLLLKNELNKRASEMTRDLQDAYMELKGVDKMRNDLLSSISNDLRRPLTTIRTSAETILNGNDKMTPLYRDLLATIINQSNGCISHVNSVLNHNTSEAKPSWFPKQLHPNEILTKSIYAKIDDLSSNQLDLQVATDNHLPSFVANEERIYQVFSNLLSNAIKFTPPGGHIVIKGKVIEKKRTEDSTDYLQFSISDTGVGISSENLPNVFKRTIPSREKMAATNKRPTQGLSICKDIINYHGGRIWLDSALGKGTTVHLLLPVSGPYRDFHEQSALEQWNKSQLLSN